MDFWGVCGEEETEDSLCCRDLLLVFSAGNSLLPFDLFLPSKRRGGRLLWSCLSAVPQLKVLVPGFEQNTQRKCCRGIGLLEEGEKCVRSKEKSSLPWQ